MTVDFQELTGEQLLTDFSETNSRPIAIFKASAVQARSAFCFRLTGFDHIYRQERGEAGWNVTLLTLLFQKSLTIARTVNPPGFWPDPNAENLLEGTAQSSTTIALKYPLVMPVRTLTDRIIPDLSLNQPVKMLYVDKFPGYPAVVRDWIIGMNGVTYYNFDQSGSQRELLQLPVLSLPMQRLLPQDRATGDQIADHIAGLARRGNDLGDILLETGEAFFAEHF